MPRDVSPLRDLHVWLPMTGVSDSQMDAARAAGYDTILIKAHPLVSGGSDPTVNFADLDAQIKTASSKGFRVLIAVLGWVGLGEGEFWDTRENGERIPNRLDPFWPEAMLRLEWYFEQVVDRYAGRPEVAGFAPTWGIYGEAGFTSWDAGRSEYALARYNEWRKARGLAAAEVIPTRAEGPNTEYNRFILFRYQYIERVFDQLIGRLKTRAKGSPVGMWQELYPIVGYLWNMVEVPSADFALYESCFTFQTSHHPEKTLAETMGFRYRCRTADQYRDYYLPLLARKRGEGQRFMGCQLTGDYAVTNYGWSAQRAEQSGFDRWDDEFSDDLKTLLDQPLENPERDVLLVFPTYAAATLPDHPRYSADAMLWDVLLRSYGCQMERYASPRLDKMTVGEMDKFRLIVIPASSFLLSETWSKLKKTRATVVVTGSFGKAMDGVLAADGQAYEVDGWKLTSGMIKGGGVRVAKQHPLTHGLDRALKDWPVTLSDDDSFRFRGKARGVETLLESGAEPMLSTAYGGRVILVHGQIFSASCYNPGRKPRNLSGSADASANENDMWGPYDSADPRNWFAVALVRNIIDCAGVAYRVPHPKPRTVTRYLGDHMEQASVSANIAYNNTSRVQTLTVRTPYSVEGLASRRIGDAYETRVTVPAYGYTVLRPER